MLLPPPLHPTREQVAHTIRRDAPRVFAIYLRGIRRAP